MYCICMLSCVLDVDFFFSSLRSPFSISIWTSFVSACIFVVGATYAVSSVSVSAATRLAYSYDTYLDAYVR